MTNYAALFVLSIADTLGFAGFLAINVVYMSEIMGPKIRPRIMMVSQTVCIFLLLVILTGIIPHYMFPGQYKQYLWILAALNILIAIALYFRMPESPRWLEARERRDKARKVMERMEMRASRGGRIALANPDLQPYEVVAEEKTSWLAVFGKRYVLVTTLLLVVMVLGYGGIVYGGASQAFLFLALNRGYSAGGVFALIAWSGVAASIVYLLNAFFGGRFERRYTQLFGAVLFAGGWWGVYAVHSTVWVDIFYVIATIGTILWLWSMYVYIPQVYPTRMRSLGTGWTDGVGHLGAWGGVLIAGQLYMATAPGASSCSSPSRARSSPASYSRSSGRTSASVRWKNCPDRRWAAGRAVSRRLFPEVSPAAQAGCHRRPSPHPSRPPAHAELDGRPAHRASVARRLRENQPPTHLRNQPPCQPGSRAGRKADE